MSFIKKQKAGFYITVLTLISMVVSMVFYLINCRTEYFSKTGVSGGIILCLIIAVVLDLAYVICSNRLGQQKCFDIFPIASGMILMIAFVLFLNERVSSIATIMSFQKSAQTMSDLSSAIVAMAACFIAALLNMMGSFFKVLK